MRSISKKKQPEQPNYKTILIGKIIVCALGIILGLIVTATSGNISAPYNTADTNNYNEYYNSADYAEFGTDYYTYVYKALKITTENTKSTACLLYTSPSPRDVEESRMPSSA